MEKEQRPCGGGVSRQFSIAFAFVSILCCPFQGMVMVVSRCPTSLLWERHQRLRLRMAIGVVLCEFADTPASSISSPFPPRSQEFATFDGYVAVSGSFVYMKGYNSVGSSSVEIPVTNPSHALHTFPIGTRPHCGLSDTSPLSCWAAISVATCCTSVTCVVRFGHLPVLLFFPLRRTRTFFILCAFLLSMRASVSGVCCSYWGASFCHWLPRLSCRRKLHRSHDRV